MTGYESKKAMAQAKVEGPLHVVCQCDKCNAKNASKPVAWLEPEWGEKICPEVGYEVTMTDDHPRDLCWIPLYAQRPWVGLTDEERVSFDATNPKTQKEWDELFDGIEDKLKEKNNG